MSLKHNKPVSSSKYKNIKRKERVEACQQKMQLMCLPIGVRRCKGGGAEEMLIKREPKRSSQRKKLKKASSILFEVPNHVVLRFFIRKEESENWGIRLVGEQFLFLCCNNVIIAFRVETSTNDVFFWDFRDF